MQAGGRRGDGAGRFRVNGLVAAAVIRLIRIYALFSPDVRGQGSPPEAFQIVFKTVFCTEGHQPFLVRKPGDDPSLAGMSEVDDVLFFQPFCRARQNFPQFLSVVFFPAGQKQ